MCSLKLLREDVRWRPFDQSNVRSLEIRRSFEVLSRTFYGTRSSMRMKARPCRLRSAAMTRRQPLPLRTRAPASATRKWARFFSHSFAAAKPVLAVRADMVSVLRLRRGPSIYTEERYGHKTLARD